MATRLTVNIRASGFVELITDSGHWVAPGFNGFPSIASARAWAKSEGFILARSYTHNS